MNARGEPPSLPEPLSDASPAEREISELARQLQSLKNSLGSDFWENGEVGALQQKLRQQLSGYNAWSEDSLPMHQRARRAARLESAYAHLLWPGRSDQ